MAWPLFLDNVLSTAVHYADTIMVGQLGAYATAAVSLCNPVMFLITGTVLAMGVGITALVARAVGQNDPAMVKKLSHQSLLLSIYFGIPFCVVYGILHRQVAMWMGAGPDVIDHAAIYNLIISIGRPFSMLNMVLASVLRGAGDTKTPMKINITSNILNVIFNFFLINPTREVNLFGAALTMPGAGWGVAGAAAATTISMIFGGIALTLILVRRPGMTQISFKDGFRLDWQLFKRINKISLPAMFERVSTTGAGIMINRAIASLGTVAMASNTLFATATELTLMPAFAMGSVATTAVGQFLGAKRPKDAEKYVYRICRYGLIIIIPASVLMYFFAEPLIKIFTPDPEVIVVATRCLKLASFIQPIQFLAFALPGALRGAGDTKITTYIITLANWGCRAIMTTIAVNYWGAGMDEVVYWLGADMLLRAVLFFWRFKTGRWKNAITD